MVLKDEKINLIKYKIDNNKLIKYAEMVECNEIAYGQNNTTKCNYGKSNWLKRPKCPNHREVFWSYIRYKDKFCPNTNKEKQVVCNYNKKKIN